MPNVANKLNRSIRSPSSLFNVLKKKFSHVLLSILLFSTISGPAHGRTSSDGLNLDQYRGKVVYIDFWASWCGPCRLSFPYMQRLLSSYPNDRFVLLAVNVDHSQASADAFLARFGPDMPVVFDPGGRIAAQFHVAEMPTSILIDRQGRVRYVHKGFYDEQTPLYDSHISELINEK